MTEIAPLDQNQIAALMGVSVVTVSRRQRDENDPLPMIAGGKGRGNKAEYDAAAFGKWLKRQWTQQVDTLDLDRERALNLQADTALKRIKEQQLLGELAPINILEWALSSVCAQIGASLETLPAKMKRRLPQLNAADLEIIRKEIAKARNAAAAARIDYAVNDDEANQQIHRQGNDNPAATSPAQTERMGG
jgi:phage terminase Nu1 subunit (DNA packaging protein)